MSPRPHPEHPGCPYRCNCAGLLMETNAHEAHCAIYRGDDLAAAWDAGWEAGRSFERRGFSAPNPHRPTPPAGGAA